MIREPHAIFYKFEELILDTYAPYIRISAYKAPLKAYFDDSPKSLSE